MSRAAVVLAAGLGTRMRSPMAKVLHPLLGRPMVRWIVDALQSQGADVVVVVHHHEEQVRGALADAGVRFARQTAPRGTGDALLAALPELPDGGPVLVTAGDTPLLRAESVARLLGQHRGHATVAAFEARDPSGYGRVVEGVGIVEEAACTPRQREIRLVNSGFYVFDMAYLRRKLPALQPHPPNGEYWLTDLVDTEARVVAGFGEEEFLGVNDRAALAEARDILSRRINRAWATQGVEFDSIEHALVEAGVRLEPGARVGYGTVIRGESRVAGELGEGCVVVDSIVEAGATVRAGTVCEGAVVRSGAVVGPLARLRPGARVESGARVGNFCEVKNATLHPGAKVNHLSYVGDASIGAGSNIGAGAITCNYDGVQKHHTEVGEGVFIGTNVSLVAPVTVGAGAIVGAGTVVGQDVPADAIAVGRPELKIHRGRAEKLRARKRAARR
ncbi:MAG: bifunctional UDP-N-acetylglucosamine diphosphorylase/glucosamine-1-phosphate N-acetyltransferase GlmU [Deltaproteobacteria bacterium]|nr:bifunctional UDP-N-acetylglucosamine diphosphorylase/glucosamine-1-phosphate N-acetyltransferase GlmU [Deltaproteobacteria bacterium]